MLVCLLFAGFSVCLRLLSVLCRGAAAVFGDSDSGSLGCVLAGLFSAVGADCVHIAGWFSPSVQLLCCIFWGF